LSVAPDSAWRFMRSGTWRLSIRGKRCRRRSSAWH
jgi:hypothetical protein